MSFCVSKTDSGKFRTRHCGMVSKIVFSLIRFVRFRIIIKHTNVIYTTACTCIAMLPLKELDAAVYIKICRHLQMGR